MEILIVSLIVYLCSCAALATGLWFGRAPFRAGCRPEGCARRCGTGRRCASGDGS